MLAQWVTSWCDIVLFAVPVYRVESDHLVLCEPAETPDPFEECRLEETKKGTRYARKQVKDVNVDMEQLQKILQQVSKSQQPQQQSTSSKFPGKTSVDPQLIQGMMQQILLKQMQGEDVSLLQKQLQALLVAQKGAESQQQGEGQGLGTGSDGRQQVDILCI